jgi:hypothetical protein
MTAYQQGFEDCKKQVKAAMVLAVEEAILMEREACAQLCDDEGRVAPASQNEILNKQCYRLADLIRARWQK